MTTCHCPHKNGINAVGCCVLDDGCCCQTVQKVVARCDRCNQTRTFTGRDAVERAEMWSEDGNHACIDLLDGRDDREIPCPECDEGEVIPDGPMEWDTGHWPVRCSHRCGFTS